MSESFAQLFEQSMAKIDMRPGAMVVGTVVDITDESVIVNAGLKSEGVIPIDQFYNTEGDLEVNIGDQPEP